MYTKLNLLPAKVASRYSLKPELRAVAFYGNRTVATDSFRLLEVSADGEALPEPELYRAEMVGKYKPEKGVLKFESVDMGLLNDNIHGDKKYPDIDQVLKTAEEGEYTEVSINGQLLGELLQLMAKCNKFGQVKMRVPHEKSRAIYLTAENGKQTMRGLCMPLNK